MSGKLRGKKGPQQRDPEFPTTDVRMHAEPAKTGHEGLRAGMEEAGSGMRQGQPRTTSDLMERCMCECLFWSYILWTQ